ncbi:MAG: exodeoxyribonuclease VII small subunit [Lachnospiraceae bacterium]|nr:exodeoxyribonuclease VII small subunit [Lachnospiraceae bacterium]
MSTEKKRSATAEDNTEVASVEEGFKILEETVNRLSEEDISLEDSFSEFEKGMKVLKAVNEKIDRVEKKVKVITEEAGDEFL